MAGLMARLTTGARVGTGTEAGSKGAIGGIAGWVIARLRSPKASAPRLALLERISLAPRQSLALVEAEGRRFLVATSAEGAPAFYPIEDSAHLGGARFTRPAAHGPARVSW